MEINSNPNNLPTFGIPDESYQPPVSVVKTQPPNSETTIQNKPKSSYHFFLYLAVALVVIITLIAFGIIFLSFSKDNKNINNQNGRTTVTAPLISPVIKEEGLKNTDSSDEIVNIEKDLQNINLSNIDAEVGSISSLLNQP